jgi:hypothetical protein
VNRRRPPPIVGKRLVGEVVGDAISRRGPHRRSSVAALRESWGPARRRCARGFFLAELPGSPSGRRHHVG